MVLLIFGRPGAGGDVAWPCGDGRSKSPSSLPGLLTLLLPLYHCTHTIQPLWRLCLDFDLCAQICLQPPLDLLTGKSALQMTMHHLIFMRVTWHELYYTCVTLLATKDD